MLQFYKVKSSYFVPNKKYSFEVYLYDTRRDKRLVSLHSGIELTQELFDDWNSLEKRGAFFQVYRENLREFYYETEISEEELIDFNEFYFRMYNLQQKRLEMYEEKSNETFLLKNTLRDIGLSQDFLPLIQKVKAEIMCFPLHESEMVSFTTELVDRLFVSDIIPVRVACLSYIVAKQNKITDNEQLCIIVVSALLKDLGFGMIKSSLFSDFKTLQEDNIYSKHPMLTIYILSKVGFDFHKGIKRLILESHEQADGSGFPREKKDGHIDYISYIVNMCDQIIMYSAGLINGRKVDLVKTIELFNKGVNAEGINTSFPQRLLDSLATLLLNEIEKELIKKNEHLNT